MLFPRRIALALAIPILGLVELGLAAHFSHKAPTPEDWSASRARVTELRKSVDAIVIAPWWAEPHARKTYGDDLLPLRDVARPDDTRYPKLLEVSAVGEHLPELDGWRVLSDETLAHSLHARVLENPEPAHVRTDFADRIEQGRASALYRFPGRDESCTWKTEEPVVAPGLFGFPAMPPKRFSCGNQPWLSIGVTVQDDENYRARRCIWSHPPPNGNVVVRFDDAPLGTVIRGHIGIHETLDREKRGAPVDLDVTVDGELLGHGHHEDGDGWSLFVVPLAAHQNAPAARVDFTLRTRDANERHICWEADSR